MPGTNILDALKKQLNGGDFDKLSATFDTIARMPMAIGNGLAQPITQGNANPMESFAQTFDTLIEARQIIAGSLQQKLNDEWPGSFARIIAILQPYPDLLRDVTPDMIAKGVQLFRERDLPDYFAHTLTALKDGENETLLAAARQAGLRAGMMATPTSEMPADTFNKTFPFVAIVLRPEKPDVDISVHIEGNKKSSVKQILRDFAFSRTEVTTGWPSRLPTVVKLLADVAESGDDNPPFKRAAQTAIVLNMDLLPRVKMPGELHQRLFKIKPPLPNLA